MSSIDDNSLKELIASAATPEDLQAVAELLAEAESHTAQQAASRDKWEVATLGDVAEFFGLQTQTVKQWRTESPPMPGQEGAWPLPDIVKWRHQKAVQSDVRTAKQQADLELQQVAVEQKRLDLARQKGELVALADVERTVAEFVVIAREMALQLPESIAASSSPADREHARREAEVCVKNMLAMILRKAEDVGITEAEVDPAS